MIKVFWISTKFWENEGRPCQHELAMEEVGIKCYPFYFREINALYGPGKMNSMLLEKACEFKPDLLWMFKCDTVQAAIIKQIKEATNCLVFMWFGDARTELERELRERIDILDLLLLNNSEQLEWYRKQGFKRVGEWHIGVEPAYHRRYWAPKDYEVVFGGNYHGSYFPLSEERTKLLQAIDERFRLLVLGDRWKSIGLKNVRPYIADEIGYCKAVCKAKISLGINAFDFRHYYNRRLFQNMAAGVMHLTRYIPGMERDFEIGKHLDVFHSIPEAIEKIEYYLKRDRKRRQIAKAGQKLVHEKYTWAERYKELLEKFKIVREEEAIGLFQLTRY
jgi:spore maturation protein CgeB